MLLSPPDVYLFFTLHKNLMFFVNDRLKVLPQAVPDADAFSALPPAERLKVRDAFVQHPELLTACVQENPAGLSEEELDILRSWRHHLAGQFFWFRQLQSHAVFLSTSDPPRAYAVLALADPFSVVVPRQPPVMLKTLLLPFRDRIIYDSIMVTYNVSFGPGVRRSLNERYKRAKIDPGLITSLLPSDEPRRAAPPRPRPPAPPPTREQRQDVLQTITTLTDDFCRRRLNQEYADLCRALAEKLARKRPSPLLRGDPRAWASGIVRTIGWVNFLHDKTQTPYMRLTDIDQAFGIAESTGAAKLAAIRKMLKIHQLDSAWTLPSKLESNPDVWILQVNGLLMDIRTEPREMQESAFRKGLIPWIPADRPRPPR